MARLLQDELTVVSSTVYCATMICIITQTAGFTLQEEARNTEKHQSFWNTDQRLRHKNVQFVSAGKLDPQEVDSKDAENALAQMTLESPQEDTSTKMATSEETVTSAAPLTASAPTSVVPSPVVEEQISSYFVVDTQGEPVDNQLPPPKVRATSPTPSNSSEDVILFGGRDSRGKGISRASESYKPQASSLDTKIRIVEDEIHEREELLEEVLREKSVSPHLDLQLVNPEKRSSTRERSHRSHHHRDTKQDEEAILADYIANIDDDDDLFNNNTFRPRELGGADGIEESSVELIEDDVEPLQGRWDRSDICDFGDLSTSDEAMGEVREIISKRERNSGVQYLVVWDNQTVDDARWVPLTTLTAASALYQIELFETGERLVAEFRGEEGKDTSDTDHGTDENEDNEDLLQRKIDRMSDEQIARILAKQEELGIGSHEILLFGDEDDAEDGVGMDVAHNTPNAFVLGSRLDQSRGRGARRPRGDFPSATAMADAYDGFDVMDFDRPSLKKKPKGRKGKLAFDLSDSELEASMQMAYENDRIKKKQRKLEREELRAQGLLGNKNGKPDLKQKYKEGMGIHDVKEEVKRFLMGDNTT